MRMPTVFAASRTLVPSGTVAFLPSMVSSTMGLAGVSLTGRSSAIQLAGDDGEASQVGGEIRDHRSLQHLVHGGEDVEAGRPAVQAVGLRAAVGRDAERSEEHPSELQSL